MPFSRRPSGSRSRRRRPGVSQWIYLNRWRKNGRSRRYVVKSVFVGAAYADTPRLRSRHPHNGNRGCAVDDRVVADRADVDQPAVVVDVDEAPVVGADEPTAETRSAFDVVVQFSVLFPHRVFAEKPDAAVGRIIIQVHSAVDTSREDNAPVAPTAGNIDRDRILSEQEKR